MSPAYCWRGVPSDPPPRRRGTKDRWSKGNNRSGRPFDKQPRSRHHGCGLGRSVPVLLTIGSAPPTLPQHCRDPASGVRPGAADLAQAHPRDASGQQAARRAGIGRSTLFRPARLTRNRARAGKRRTSPPSGYRCSTSAPPVEGPPSRMSPGGHRLPRNHPVIPSYSELDQRTRSGQAKQPSSLHPITAPANVKRGPASPRAGAIRRPQRCHGLLRSRPTHSGRSPASSPGDPSPPPPPPSAVPAGSKPWRRHHAADRQAEAAGAWVLVTPTRPPAAADRARFGDADTLHPAPKHLQTPIAAVSALVRDKHAPQGRQLPGPARSPRHTALRASGTNRDSRNSG